MDLGAAGSLKTRFLRHLSQDRRALSRTGRKDPVVLQQDSTLLGALLREGMMFLRIILKARLLRFHTLQCHRGDPFCRQIQRFH